MFLVSVKEMAGNKKFALGFFLIAMLIAGAGDFLASQRPPVAISLPPIHHVPKNTQAIATPAPVHTMQDYDFQLISRCQPSNDGKQADLATCMYATNVKRRAGDRQFEGFRRGGADSCRQTGGIAHVGCRTHIGNHFGA